MDIKDYFKQAAVKAEVEQELLDQALTLLGNEKVGKLISDNFKMLPDYSRDMEATRDKARREGADLTKQEYQAWYEDTKRKHQAYEQAIAQAEQYEKRFGKLDDGNKGGHDDRANNPPAGLTAEQVEQMLQERMAQRDRATLDLLNVSQRYSNQFKEPLNTDEFETFWKEHPEYGSMSLAYEKFVAPRIEEAREAELQAKLDARYQEGLKDGRTRDGGLPGDTGPKGFSPLFDRKADVAKLDDSSQSRHSREAFQSGWSEASESA